jgi:hypothetical protein
MCTEEISLSDVILVENVDPLCPAACGGACILEVDLDAIQLQIRRHGHGCIRRASA